MHPLQLRADLVLVLAATLLVSGCKDKDKEKGGPSSAEPASTGGGGPSVATEDEPPPGPVKCNKQSIFKHFEPSNGGATAHAAFLLFLSSQRAKAPNEGWPEKSAFKWRGGVDMPMYYSQKDGRTVAHVEMLPNINGTGFYVETYEVCPKDD